MPKVFMSYAREDLRAIRKLDPILIVNYCIVWRDETSLFGGQHWPKAIGEAIQTSDFMLLVWSKNTERSKMVEFEWNTAIALGKDVIPCLIDETPLPPTLTSINGILLDDFARDFPKYLKSVSEGVFSEAPEFPEAVIDQLDVFAPPLPDERIGGFTAAIRTLRRWLSSKHGAWTVAALAVIALLISVALGLGYFDEEESSPAKKPGVQQLEKAMVSINAGEYDRAIGLLSTLGDDTTADRSVRKDAFRYLAQSYIAMNREDGAFQALKALPGRCRRTASRTPCSCPALRESCPSTALAAQARCPLLSGAPSSGLWCRG